MSKLKIQIKSVFGNVLFEYEKENNTIEDTLSEAIKRNANLSYADLSYTNLSYANLKNADLSYANLSYANLIDADLSGANLKNANIPIGRCKWAVTYTIEGVINIGCKSKTVSDWDKWFEGNEQFETKRDTPEFEAIYKSYLMAKCAIEIGFY